MKKNWPIIVALIGFIFAYQFFVLRPIQQKKIEAQQIAEAQKAATQGTTNSEQTTANSAATTTTSQTVSTPSNPSVTKANWTSVKLDLGSMRYLVIEPGLKISRAVIGDYKIRSKTQHAVELLTEGGVFRSSSEALQNCISSVQPRGANITDAQQAREWSFVGQSAGVNCEIVLGAAGDQAGLARASVRISGLKEKATLEFVAQGIPARNSSLDNDPKKSIQATEHSYLSYNIVGKTARIRDKDLKEITLKQGVMKWFSWGDNYFATLIIPEGKFNPDLKYGPANPAAEFDVKNPVQFSLSYPLSSELAVNGTQSVDWKFYFGARDTSVLNSISADLVDSVDLGFFAAIARIMLWALNALHRIVGNYGWSIVLLTLIVRLLFWPLNKKAFAAGAQMKAIQPEIEKIRAKYGKERAEEMNKEIFALYRTKKVNPMGSCLPMLMQIPIFIGLYSALNHSIDLYQAPFFWWIQDLSSKDPFYVFPALWTISLLIYMRLNPQQMQTQPGMPDMKWMMMGMNLFFGFLSASWPSGLTIYLFVSNSVGIAQQFFIQRSNKLVTAQEGA